MVLHFYSVGWILPWALHFSLAKQLTVGCVVPKKKKEKGGFVVDDDCFFLFSLVLFLFLMSRKTMGSRGRLKKTGSNMKRLGEDQKKGKERRIKLVS